MKHQNGFLPLEMAGFSVNSKKKINKNASSILIHWKVWFFSHIKLKKSIQIFNIFSLENYHVHKKVHVPSKSIPSNSDVISR